MLDTFIKIFAPFSTAFDATDYNMSVLVGNADLGAVGAPPERDNSGHFSIIDHLVDPLFIMLHKHDDEPATVATSELTVLVVPVDNFNIGFVVC